MGQDIKRGLWLGMLGLGLLLTALACGGGSEAVQPQAAAATGPVQEVRLSMGDFFYDPKELTLQSGKVKFVLTNVGQTAHRFAISGEGVKVSTKNVSAGRGDVMEIELGPGIYKMGCTLDAHEARGSVGQIIVR